MRRAEAGAEAQEAHVTAPQTTAPRAFARLHFHPGFSLEAALPLVDYLADLGISHVCASPLMKGRGGRWAGLNVADFSTIDPELGGEGALRQLVFALRRRQMGLILEITPGHMGVGGGENAWWLDVLEWGRDSAHAQVFDADWQRREPYLRGKLLAPFLDRPYGEALRAGALTLAFEPQHGSFAVRHHDHIFPISPTDYPKLMAAAAPLGSVAEAFSRLASIRRDADLVLSAKQRLAQLAATDAGRKAIAATLAAFDPATDDGRGRLHALLERQNYRLAHRVSADDDLNWRRHPATTELAAVRLERADVFDAVHAYVIELYASGLIDGVRVRHFDSFAQPAGYLQRLTMKLALAAPRRASGAPHNTPQGAQPGLPHKAIILTDKVLKIDETLPPRWDIAGAGGVEVMEAISALLHDGPAGSALASIWSHASGDRRSPEEHLEAARRQVLLHDLSAQLDTAARALHGVALSELSTRDVPLAAIRRVLVEFAIALPCWRIYADASGASAQDREALASALERAARRLLPDDLPIIALFARWLGGEAPRDFADFEMSGAREEAMARVQQLTAAMAELAMSQIVAYGYGRLMSRNEAESDPALFAIVPKEFHRLMGERRRLLPTSPSATSGSVRKRGEDSRMRLAVLSEQPREWTTLLRDLMDETSGLRVKVGDGFAPDMADEVMLYQTLIGAWPSGARHDDARAVGRLRDKVEAALRLGLRLSRSRRSRAADVAAYEDGCVKFLAALLEGEPSLAARRMLAQFAEQLAPAGVVNSLSQLVLKCTVPGVPDFCQGTETWDFGLESPVLQHGPGIVGRIGISDGELAPDRLLETWQDGRVKQQLTARLLRLRKLNPALFAQGSYEPLAVDGMRAENAVAFRRRNGADALVVIVTRLASQLVGTGPITAREPARVPAVRWGDTGVMLPPDSRSATFRDVVTGRDVQATLGRIEVRDALSSFPAAVLVKL